MTAHADRPQRPRQEPDRTPLRGIAVATLASVAVVAAAIAWAGFLDARLVPERALPQAISSADAPVRIGLLYQSQIPAKSTRDELARARENLASYGWVDRERGVVRIPIDRAMELRAREGR